MLPTFCEKCGTMHGKGRPCDPKGLKARSSTVKPSAHNAPVAGSTPAAPTITEIIEVTTAVGKKLFPEPEDAPPTPLEKFLVDTVVQEMECIVEGINPEKSRFDRTSYQRDYMRDLHKAKAEGLTVKQWREKHKDV